MDRSCPLSSDRKDFVTNDISCPSMSTITCPSLPIFSTSTTLPVMTFVFRKLRCPFSMDAIQLRPEAHSQDRYMNLTGTFRRIDPETTSSAVPPVICTEQSRKFISLRADKISNKTCGRAIKNFRRRSLLFDSTSASARYDQQWSWLLS